MSNSPPPPDPDDIFADTRMSFGDHIEDLRTHLWRAIKGFFLACVLGFFLGKPVLAFIARPVEQQLQGFYDRRVEDIQKNLKDDPDLQKINSQTSWEAVSYPAEQLRALIQGDLKTVNNFKKPPDDLDDAQQVRLYQRINSPLQHVIMLSKAQQQIGRRPTLSTLSVSEALMV